MNSYGAVDLLTGLIEAIVTFMFFDNYMIRRYNCKRYIYWIGAILLAVGINASNIFFRYNYLNLVVITLMMTLSTFAFRTDIKSRIIFSIINIIILAGSEIIVMFFISALAHIDKMEAYLNPQARFMGIVFSKALNIAIVKAIFIFSKKGRFKMPLSYWILYLTVFIIDGAVIYIIFSNQSDNGIHMQVICSIGLLYRILITLHLYEQMAVQAENLKEKELLEQQFSAQVSHLQELILAQEQIGVYHDLANHMLSLKAYMDNHNYEAGDRYLSRLIEKTDICFDVIDTGNTVLDAIITSKRSLARKYDIDFRVDLQIPENLAINSTDCCVIFGNALDNAIEACEKLNSKRYINMKVVYHDNILSCKITNPASKESVGNTTLKTTKQDAQHHGIGTKNIKRTLDKYKNAYRMEYENDEFIFAFMIYNISDETE